MDPVTLGLISMGVGGAVKVASDLFDDTASRQANLMRKEADLKLSTLEENMRRTEGAQTQVLSSTKARAAATGFASDSASFDRYLTGMAAEFQRQNDFTKTQGMAQVDLMRESADILGSPVPKFIKAATDIFGTGTGIAGLLKPGG